MSRHAPDYARKFAQQVAGSEQDVRTRERTSHGKGTGQCRRERADVRRKRRQAIECERAIRISARGG